MCIFVFYAFNVHRIMADAEICPRILRLVVAPALSALYFCIFIEEVQIMPPKDPQNSIFDHILSIKDTFTL